MKHEGGKQANNSVRNALRHFSIGVAFRNVGIGKGVNPTPRTIEFALPVETNKIFPWKADSLDVAGPNHPVVADVLHNFPKRLRAGVFQYVIT
jgi:hypothetical protein